MVSSSVNIPLEPINKPNHTTLPRHPTLEAQRKPSTTTRRSKSWIGALLANDDIDDDIIEQKLKDAIAKSDGDDRRYLKGLLSAYSRLKDNQSYGIGHELSGCLTITDGSRDGVVSSMNSSIGPDVSGLKYWTKAKSTFCALTIP